MRAKWMLLAAGSLLAIQTQTARAQTADDQAPDFGQEAVVITGSRVVSDGSRAPTPVTVVSSEQLQQASPGAIGEALNQLPTFRGSTRPSSGNFSATGPNSGSFLNLRNLGAQRTLVLLDGRRATPSALLGTTDTNLLPQELVNRVDIVTGGASAAYGSDAVSGVVNFVLDTDFEGVRGSLQGGISSESDSESFKGTLSGGFGFDNGRGHVIASASYYEIDGLQSIADRSWGAEGWGTLPDPTNPARLLILPNLNSALTTRGGLIVSPPFAGMQFTPEGELAPFDPGGPRGTLNQVGGDGARPLTNLSADVDTSSAFIHADYDITPQFNVYAQLGFAEAHNRYVQTQQFNIPGLNGFTIFSGNAFLPSTLQAQMTAFNVPAFLLGRINFDFGAPAIGDALNDTIDAAAGFSFDTSNGWTIDGYVQHGENRQRIRTENNVIVENLFAAADAVVDSGIGDIVCRVTLTNPGLHPGCTPINLFGEGAPSDAALDYVLGTAYYRASLTQDVAALSIRGEPFSTWAGPVGFAAGFEYRQEEAEQVSDSISQNFNDATGIRGFPAIYNGSQGGFILTNAQPVSGSYDIREGFAEVQVPLAENQAWARALDLNAAVRHTDYSTSGGVDTWKAGLSYEPIDGVRLRVTQSRDIRAPNVAELFSGSVQGQGTVIDPANGATAVITSAVGNPDLQPETADTFTVGLVLTPIWLDGLVASIDYYNIEVEGVIASLTAQQTVDQCAQGSEQACVNIVRNDSGVITRIFRPGLNLNQLSTSGVDFELSYRFDAPPVIGGDLTVRALFSYLAELETIASGAAPRDQAGEVGLSANPEWSGQISLNWENGAWGVFVQERYVGEGVYDVTRIDGVTIDDNDVDPVFYTDATLTYRFGDEAHAYQAFLTVNNAFDEEPPIVPSGTLGAFYPTNPALYDVIGRYYTAGVRFQF